MAVTMLQFRTFALTRRPRFTILHNHNPKYFPSECAVRRLLWLRTDEPFTYEDIETQILSAALPSDGLDPDIDFMEVYPSKVYSERSYIKLVVFSRVY